LRRAAREHHPRLLHFPDRLHAQPARAALRHRSDRSGEVGHAHARQLVLGLRVPELELPPRASLFPRRAVLQPPARPAPVDAVLRAQENAMAHLRPARLRLADRKPGAAHRLERGAPCQRTKKGCCRVVSSPRCCWRAFLFRISRRKSTAFSSAPLPTATARFRTPKPSCKRWGRWDC